MTRKREERNEELNELKAPGSRKVTAGVLAATKVLAATTMAIAPVVAVVPGTVSAEGIDEEEIPVEDIETGTELDGDGVEPGTDEEQPGTDDEEEPGTDDEEDPGTDDEQDPVEGENP
ncbi:hypothetical protein M5W83_29070, partial [Paenibacillus thiaminolyticus]|nr:hypothetical protein [Paenibacillus thiaminolyticus]MCY9602861.1 hypothetical protein [Paenibacillus thiaminolyticus]MCY9611202.1 hypothetical protein [Paenibacillus thiaminolyticus]MCY9616859.1 hypothetical protein [Paenibacillus thiaminolyticus]MCY9622498.1 hypothetical protein [Paenibacillus thiaminolyticus]